MDVMTFDFDTFVTPIRALGPVCSNIFVTVDREVANEQLLGHKLPDDTDYRGVRNEESSKPSQQVAHGCRRSPGEKHPFLYFTQGAHGWILRMLEYHV